MSSPIGELPIRRHLLPEVAALLLQAAAGARRRTLRRQALLGERPLPGLDDEWLSGAPAETAAVGEAAPARHVLSVSKLQPGSGQAPRIDPERPGAAGPLPELAASHQVPTAFLEAAPPHSAPALLPPAVRLMQAAALRAERARALEREALAAVAAPPLRRIDPAAAPAVTARHAPFQAGRLAAATPTHSVNIGSIGVTGMVAGAETRYAHPFPALNPTEPHHFTSPVSEASAYTYGGAPFGPHPAPPGPAIGPFADRATPAAGSTAYPESDLLKEERLREQLARILRADGLRHGLDLKER
ncbi:MAG TPA: hypothetical protein VNT75_02675 [Symbiobacteriaceae bacterium]|nr:hypothetical protein [Symbiobacteriaceae bacterium]